MSVEMTAPVTHMEATESIGHSMSMEATAMVHGGHLYMQTNELRNAVVHYVRANDGVLTEAERYHTGGAGSGLFKPISGQ